MGKQGPSINLANMSVDLAGIDKSLLLVPVPRNASVFTQFYLMHIEKQFWQFNCMV